MASIELNKNNWDQEYTWDENGDEWSVAWGTAELQWHTSIYPKIHQFLPANTILEIAPGRGRWTQFLLEHCSNLKILDLSSNCIEFCKQRFQKENKIEYHVNDGKSLSMIADNSVDFLFSYDSLVHVDKETLASYIQQFKRILKPEGVAFIHHSNLKNHINKIDRPGVGTRIKRLIGVENAVNKGWRAPDVGYQDVLEICNDSGLKCLRQELTSWEKTNNVMIDCNSVICHEDHFPEEEYRLFENPDLIKNANYIKRINTYYELTSKVNV